MRLFVASVIRHKSYYSGNNINCFEKIGAQRGSASDLNHLNYGGNIVNGFKKIGAQRRTVLSSHP